MTRLPYETKGGILSEGDTFAQLIEYLRLAAECCYSISNINNIHHRTVRGLGFHEFGKMLERVSDKVTEFSTTRMQ